MKIGFDVSQTGAGKAGCGFYAHALAQSLIRLAPNEAFHFYPSFGDFFLDPTMPEQNPYVSPGALYGPKFVDLSGAREFWVSSDLESRLNGIDLLHSNNFWCPQPLKETRLVYTFYDMAFLEEPSWSTEANREGCFGGIFRAAVSADWVVAISEASRRHFMEVFPHFPQSHIRVIYPCSRFPDASIFGVRPDALDGIPEAGFWLSVGTIEPRKNQLGLARAYARYRELSEHPMPLVFAGGKGWLMDDFQSELRSLGIWDHVILTGYVTDEELIWLYRNCFANLYPSFFEGFGLPVLEAMQFGAPTFASNSTSIPEVLGDAGPLLPHSDHDAWAYEMRALELEPKKRVMMKEAGLCRAAMFQWEKSTRQLLGLYQEAIDCPKRRKGSDGL